MGEGSRGSEISPPFTTLSRVPCKSRSIFRRIPSPAQYISTITLSLPVVGGGIIMAPPGKTAGIQIFEKNLGSFDLTFPKILLGPLPKIPKNTQICRNLIFLCQESHNYYFQGVKVEKGFPGAKFDVVVTSFSTI